MPLDVGYSSWIVVGWGKLLWHCFVGWLLGCQIEIPIICEDWLVVKISNLWRKIFRFEMKTSSRWFSLSKDMRSKAKQWWKTSRKYPLQRVWMKRIYLAVSSLKRPEFSPQSAHCLDCRMWKHAVHLNPQELQPWYRFFTTQKRAPKIWNPKNDSMIFFLHGFFAKKISNHVLIGHTRLRGFQILSQEPIQHSFVYSSLLLVISWLFESGACGSAMIIATLLDQQSTSRVFKRNLEV